MLVSWDWPLGCKMNLLSGPVTWACCLVLSTGSVCWDCHLYLSHGFITWACQLGQLPGLVSWASHLDLSTGPVLSFEQLSLTHFIKICFLLLRFTPSPNKTADRGALLVLQRISSPCSKILRSCAARNVSKPNFLFVIRDAEFTDVLVKIYNGGIQH